MLAPERRKGNRDSFEEVMEAKDVENISPDAPEEAFEDIDSEEAEEHSADVLKKLKGKLKECQKERGEYLDGWQRAQAEMMNMKKRLADERERDKERIKVEFIERLLPLADSFEGAMQDRTAWERADSSWRQGVEQIYTQLERILSLYGVEHIGSVGDAFDPRIHDAVSSALIKEKELHHTVTEVLQRGYRMNETIIRPARVVVGEYNE